MININFIGTQEVPKEFKNQMDFNNMIVQNPYELRTTLQNQQGEKILVVYLPFIEVRHCDMYQFLQKTTPQLKTFFVVNEISTPMKARIKSSNDFIVLWKTEEKNLLSDILSYLDGRALKLRENKREDYDKRPMISPSLLPQGMINKGFHPILGGNFQNLSSEGSCVQIKAPFYQAKDFVSMSFQSKDGEYIHLEGQVRWTEWNEKEQTQSLGVQFLTRP